MLKLRILILIAFCVCAVICSDSKRRSRRHSSRSSKNCEYFSSPETVDTSYVFRFAQAPFCDCKRKSIYFSDAGAPLDTPSFFRYDVSTGEVFGANITNVNRGTTACAGGTPFKGKKDQFICDIDICASNVTWDGRSATAYRTCDLFCLDPNPGVTTDWSRTSPNGKFYLSTWQPEHCRGNQTGIYTYDPKTDVLTQVISGLRWTNGFCFDPRSKIFYLNNDCDNYGTNAYKWDKKTGKLTFKYAFYTFPQTTDSAYHTGLQVDKCGNVYVCARGKGICYRIDPKTRQIVSKFKVPATLVTSCAIYGRDLYVFSGSSLLDGVVVNTEGQTSDNPNDGKIYIFRGAVPCKGYCDKPIR